jgi:cell wall-associated NlpC family hydrolase
VGKHRAPKKNGKARAVTIAGTLGTTLGLALVAPSDAQAATYKGAAALKVVAAQKGDPYKYGATGPSRFDCSGLMLYSFGKVGKKIPRTTNDQYAKATKINAANRKVGDLVFLYSGSNEYHVMMYAGSGYVWHAPRTGERVKKEKLWTSHVRYGRL